MALGITVNYTPFEETSFGYGVGEIAAAHSADFPNATDIVKVIITKSAVVPNYWDAETGHISTPSVGTAVASFNKEKTEWIVRGQRDDVDAVLAELLFFPSDYEPVRTWQPDAVLPNTTTGVYPMDEPGFLYSMINTVFQLTVYDSSDTYVAGYNVIFDPITPVYGNQRPYWEVEPSRIQEINSYEWDTDFGGPLDFGTISHGSDTENVQVKCEFREYGDTQYAQFNYGAFTNYGDFYISDKRPASTNTTDARFDFTGSTPEAQIFLDNVRFLSGQFNTKTFDMRLTISDGVIASEVTKTLWYEQTLQVSTFASPIAFNEDQDFNLSFDPMTISNIDNIPEVDAWKAVFTLDATGQSAVIGVDAIGGSFATLANGVITIDASTLDELNDRINNFSIELEQDFDGTFAADIQIQASSTLGTYYESDPQTISFVGTSAVEAINLTTTHAYVEDQTYHFLTYPQIVHPDEEDFEVNFYLSDGNAGYLNDEGNNVVEVSADHYRVSGSKTAVNQSLMNLEFVPSADYNSAFTVTFTIDRTSGNLTYHVQSSGSFSFTGTPVAEYTYTEPASITWDEDITKTYDTNLRIIDESTENPDITDYFGTFYRVEARVRYWDGSAAQDLTDVTISSASKNLLDSYFGVGQEFDPFTMIGTKAAINQCLANMEMIPGADFTDAPSLNGDFWVEYKVIRQQDGVIYIFFSEKTPFNPGIPSDEYTYQTARLWGLETIEYLGDAWDIIDVAEGKNYSLTFTLSPVAQGILKADPIGSATVNFNNGALTITGSKQDVNDTQQNMRWVPDFNYSTDFIISVHQIQTTDNITQANGVVIDMTYDPTIVQYILDTTTRSYVEDGLEQRPLLYTDLENRDGAELITDDEVEYEATLRLDPTDQVFFSYEYVVPQYFNSDVLEERATEITFTGSRTESNDFIKNIRISAYPDQNGPVDIYFTLKRYINNKLHKTIANNVVGVSIDAVDATEVTSTSAIQYITLTGNLMHDDSTPTSKSLQNYSYGGYTYPLQILDTAKAVSNNNDIDDAPLYKIEPVNPPAELTFPSWMNNFQTKDDLNNTILENGFGVEVNDGSVSHATVYSITFNLVRQFDYNPYTGENGPYSSVVQQLNVNFQYVKLIDLYNNSTNLVLDGNYYINVRKREKSYNAIVNQYSTDTWEDDAETVEYDYDYIIASRNGVTAVYTPGTTWSYPGDQNLLITDNSNGFYTVTYDTGFTDTGIDTRNVSYELTDNTFGLKNTGVFNLKKYIMYYTGSIPINQFDYGRPGEHRMINFSSNGYTSPLGEITNDTGFYSIATKDVAAQTLYNTWTEDGWISMNKLESQYTGIKGYQKWYNDTNNVNQYFVNGGLMTTKSYPLGQNFGDSSEFDLGVWFNYDTIQSSVWVDNTSYDASNDGRYRVSVMSIPVNQPDRIYIGWQYDGLFSHTDFGFGLTDEIRHDTHPIAFTSTPTNATNEVIKAYIKDENHSFDTFGGSGYNYGFPKFRFVKSYDLNGVTYHQYLDGEVQLTTSPNIIEGVVTSKSSVISGEYVYNKSLVKIQSVDLQNQEFIFGDKIIDIPNGTWTDYNEYPGLIHETNVTFINFKNGSNHMWVALEKI